MKSLFSNKFPIISSGNKKLQEIIFKNKIDYCPYYIAICCSPERRRFFEKLWEVYEPYADKHFLSDSKKHFHQRSWEMYVTSVFLKNKIKIFPNNDEGPDIIIRDEFNNGKICVEAVACNKGSEEDRVPELEFGKLCSIPIDEMVLRLTSVISEKSEKYKEWTKKEIVKNDDPFVIALNAGALEYPEPESLILRAVFGVHHPVLKIDLKTSKDRVDRSFRSFVKKKNGGKVKCDLFFRKGMSFLSGILYSKKNVLNQEGGNDFVLVHNPNARNPLLKEKFSFLEQCFIDDKGCLVNEKSGNF